MDGMEDEEALWRRLRGQNDREAHQALFAKYSLWARSVAREVFRRVRIVQLDWSDYSQNAVIGLLEAMGRYDPTRSIEFIAYAKPRVRGAVFNGLRTYLAENSRNATRDERLGTRYESLHGRDEEDPLDQFVSIISGLAIGHLMDSLGESEVIEHTQQVERQIDAQRVGLRLRAAIRSLPEREQRVVELHYLQHVPFVQIAEMMGVTKGRVSQIHKAAMERLRSYSMLEDCRDSV